MMTVRTVPTHDYRRIRSIPLSVDRLTELFGLDGKTAVVTGGSRGIGRMIVGGLLAAAADELSTQGSACLQPRLRARVRKVAIWARVTGLSGQYWSGSCEQPAVMPAARSASMSAA